jgi:hypothetical protein
MSRRSLFYPWRSVAAPQGRRLSEDAEEWAARHRLFATEKLAKKFAAVEVGSLAALVYPGAPHEAQQTIADFLGWVFLEDDIFDEEDANEPPRLAHLLTAFAEVLDGLEPPPDAPPAVLALADVRARLRALGSEASFRRFADSMRAFWFDGVLAEAEQRSEPGLPSLERYLDLRMISVGALPCFDLIELAYGFTLHEDVVTDAEVVEMRRLGTLEIALTNDVFSYEKELKAGDPLNFVHLMHQHHGISLDDAFDRTIRVHNDVIAQFDVIAHDVERRGPALRLYVEGHRRWMRGAWDWQTAARRYRGGEERAWTP